MKKIIVTLGALVSFTAAVFAQDDVYPAAKQNKKTATCVAINISQNKLGKFKLRNQNVKKIQNVISIYLKELIHFIIEKILKRKITYIFR